MTQLGLKERAGTRIGDLSGGQRKRVSVAVELLARPSVLFLDEPTSGLDPATEFKLMELLRDLADRGCTVLCTTHVMENVYLMDQLIVVLAGRVIYTGTPQEVRDFFGVPRLATLYDRLEEKTPEQWIAAADAGSLPPIRTEAPASSPVQGTPGPFTRLRVLLQRQWAIHCSDWRNPVLLNAQPVLLAALVAWVSDDASLRLFFAYIAALWFGCSNASQEIVREWPIYRRERIAGVGPILYVAAKLLFLGAVTAFQSLLFYLTLQMFGGLGGAILWQLAALLLTAAAAVAIGSLVSALARNLMQAVLAVPLILLPFIILSGQTPVRLRKCVPAPSSPPLPARHALLRRPSAAWTSASSGSAAWTPRPPPATRSPTAISPPPPASTSARSSTTPPPPSTPSSISSSGPPPPPPPPV